MMLLYTITLVSPNGDTVVFDHGGLKVVAFAINSLLLRTDTAFEYSGKVAGDQL